MNSGKLQQQVEAQILASYQSLYRLAFTYVKNQDDAMDVVQESVCKAISTSSEVRNPAVIKSWLCRIVIHTALDLLRRRSRETSSDSLPEAGQEDRYQDTDTLRALDVLDQRERTLKIKAAFQGAAHLIDALVPGIGCTYHVKAGFGEKKPLLPQLRHV